MEPAVKYTDLENFTKDYSDLVETHGTFLALFKGSEDENGVNWCSDCVKAEPIIKKIAFPKAAEDNVPVLYVRCGLRDQWRDMTNSVRVHPIAEHIKGVPTLVLVENVSLVIL